MTVTTTKGADANNNNSVVRLSMCALGICVCYMYYGMIQESIFSHQKIGPSFVLLIQCITNSIVARVWQSLDQWLSSSKQQQQQQQDLIESKKFDGDHKTVAKSNGTSSSLPLQPTKTTQGLHHPLLALTSLCYVSAMVCSNEALHYVTYPTAVLAKSCKLIPTMAMGVLVEHKKYQWMEWMAALCITVGILIFNMSRLKHATGDEKSSDWMGLALLSTSLFMDGFLGSCQGLLKQKHSLTIPSFLVLGDNTDKGTKKSKNIPVRPPNATETMLFVNLYAILYLIPLTIVNQQMPQGLAMLQGTVSSSNLSFDMDSGDLLLQKQQRHRNLLTGLVVMNLTVAAGQICIFLTITWYSSLVCTTITTTRKFFTILLSVI